MVDVSVAESSEWIRQRIHPRAPRVGIILGSGLGPLADAIDEPIAWDYATVPGFPRSHVSGHAGRLVIGKLGATMVVAMQGRAHLYEGWTLEQATFPVRVMAELGIELLIVSNASGGIDPRFRSGQIVLMDQHINSMFRSPVASPLEDSVPTRFGIPQRNPCLYDKTWLSRAEACALELGFALPRGTYLATLGPNYETRAEYRAFATMGANMVGMSTVPETMVASQLGVPTLAFSIITNVANPDAPNKTDHADVLDWSRSAQLQLVPLIHRLLERYFAGTHCESG